MNLQRLLGPDKRTALMRKNIFFSFLIKGWSGLVTLLLVPLTLHCLGDYKNGIWLTISSMLIWIDNLDIGLGNGLRNKLATYLAQEDMKKARETVSSTFFMLALIILPVMLAAIAAVKTFDLHAFLNVDPAVIPNLGDIMAVSILFVSATFIFKFIGNFYLGLQLPAVNNLLVTVGHTLQLVGTWLVYMGGSGSLLLIAVVNTAAPLLTYLIAYPITFYGRYPKLRPSFGTFNRHAVRSLFTIGVKFFVLQIAGILLFMSSNILISKLFDPSMVTPYQIAYRYFSITMLVFTIISAPYWSATTDAYARGDMAWIRQARRRMDKIVMGVAAVLAVMVAVSHPVYAPWVGTAAHGCLSAGHSGQSELFVLSERHRSAPTAAHPDGDGRHRVHPAHLPYGALPARHNECAHRDDTGECAGTHRKQDTAAPSDTRQSNRNMD